MEEKEKIRSLLSKGLTRQGLTLTGRQIEALLLYFEELKRWNRKMSLVGFRTDEAIVRDGILESLLLLKAFQVRPNLRLIDVGSGAGLPGIPVKIAAPQLTITLVEAARRKVSFLKQAVRLLQLHGVSILQVRAETLHRDPAYREAYDLATARAVAKLPEAVTLCTPFLKPGGLLLLPVGSRWSLEIEAIKRSDLVLQGVVRTKGERQVLIIAKGGDVSRETSREEQGDRFT